MGGQIREHSPIRSLLVAGCGGTVIRVTADGRADVVWFGHNDGEGDEIEHGVPLDEIELDLDALGGSKPTLVALLIKHTRELEVACRKLGVDAQAKANKVSGSGARRAYCSGAAESYTAVADRVAAVLKSLGLDR